MNEGLDESCGRGGMDNCRFSLKRKIEAQMDGMNTDENKKSVFLQDLIPLSSA